MDTRSQLRNIHPRMWLDNMASSSLWTALDTISTQVPLYLSMTRHSGVCWTCKILPKIFRERLVRSCKKLLRQFPRFLPRLLPRRLSKINTKFLICKLLSPGQCWLFTFRHLCCVWSTDQRWNGENELRNHQHDTEGASGLRKCCSAMDRRLRRRHSYQDSVWQHLGQFANCQFTSECLSNT